MDDSNMKAYVISNEGYPLTPCSHDIAKKLRL